MKLMFDENLSPKLVSDLSNFFPGCTHVYQVGLKGESDTAIWNYCKGNDFMIVSKDTDFRERSFLKGHPPKIIWLDVGNASTKQITELMEREQERIRQFEYQKQESILILTLIKNRN